jgi:hypothetical protein
MRSAVDVSVFGYVKVEVRSRAPKLWGWNIHRSASDNVIQQSECPSENSSDEIRHLPPSATPNTPYPISGNDSSLSVRPGRKALKVAPLFSDGH